MAIIAGWEVKCEISLKLLHTQYKDHHRLTVFHHKGTCCVKCGAGKEGVRLVIRVEKTGAEHVDLVTKGGSLMTVDHIVPRYIAKQLGWSKAEIEALSNKQPMCTRCNGKKGHKITVEDLQTLEGLKLPQLAGVFA